MPVASLNKSSQDKSALASAYALYVLRIKLSDEVISMARFKAEVEYALEHGADAIRMALGTYRCMAYIDDTTDTATYADQLRITVEDMVSRLTESPPFKDVMNSQLELQLFHYRLGRKLNYMVKEIIKERDMRTMHDVLTVVFKNGHRLKTTPDEIDSDEFYATCLLMYDLPPVASIDNG